MISADTLYQLLPAVYRIRDAGQGEVLKSLLAVLAEQGDLVDADIAALYDNWFVETCAEWVVPYIGDLLGVRGLNAVSAATFTRRAQVANTIGYRRRKGTATMLEQLARDTTGWSARAVEFFQLLATTQYYNHIRLANFRTPDLRDTDTLELLNSPFDTIAHTAEVRRIASNRGRYNIPNIGIYLWRIQDYPVTRGTARDFQNLGDGRYTFHPVGYSVPLFNAPETETEVTHLAEEINVPGQLRRRPLYDELEARRRDLALGRTPAALYFGSQPVLAVYLDEEAAPVPPENVLVCNLSDDGSGGWRRPPAAKSYPKPDGTSQSFDIRVAVDPDLGRLAFPNGVSHSSVEVSYSYGFSGDFGGGPYSRNDSVAQALKQRVTFQKGVRQDAPGGQDEIRTTITAALADWNAQPAGSVGLITIMDSRTYPEALTIQVKPGSQLLIIAADWPQVDDPDHPGQKIRVLGQYAADDLRPHILGSVTVQEAGLGAPGGLVLDGLLIEGAVTFEDGALSALRLAHSTLAGLTVSAPAVPPEAPVDLAVELDHALCGPLSLAPSVASLSIGDSIVGLAHSAILAVDAAGTPADIRRSTLFGAVSVYSIEASNSIFTGTVTAVRRQIGCIRFCYVPDIPATPHPQRYRCQPDLALADITDPAEQARVRIRMTPAFTSDRYSDAGYAQLSRDCAVEIRTGAEDGSEMGAFSSLKQPQREANLRASLPEFLRFGMEAGIFFVT